MNILRKPFLPIILLILISTGFIYGLMTISSRRSTYIVDSEGLYRLNLNDPAQKDSIMKVFIDYGYVEDSADAEFIAKWISGLPNLENLGALNKPKAQIPADSIEKYGGRTLKNRLEHSLDELGWDSVAKYYYSNTSLLPSVVSAGGNCAITVHVDSIVDNRWEKLIRSINPLTDKNVPLAGVLVQLKRYYDEPMYVFRDTVKTIRGYKVNDSVVAYALTDNNGNVIFNVDANGYYSVLPIKKGFEYGIPKGTTNGRAIGEEKEANRKFEFIQRMHRLKAFDAATYSNLKADEIFGVRSLEDYQQSLWNIGLVFLLSWWIAFVILIYADKRKLRVDKEHCQASDKGIFILLMVLNALCVLMMLAIANPFTDIDYASNMVWGTILGVMGFVFFSMVDYVKYYASHYLIKFDYLSSRLKDCSALRKIYVPEGLGFVFCAMFLVLLLFLFGDAPEGSSAKVNFFGVQLSEVSKFFFVTAIATFFTDKAEWIRKLHTMAWQKQLNVVALLLLVFALLLIIYIALNKDMGPALVLIVTFVFMYSIARNDFWQLLLGIVTYGVALFYLGIFGMALWFVLWIVGWYIAKRKFHESAILMNLLFTAFIYGGELLKDTTIGKRLLDRTAMVGEGMWNNTIQGGDQIAQGVWALASGGLTGQGLANGNANFIPAFHTDMILQSIGEVMGFWMLAFILLCFMLFIGYSIYLAKKVAHPFLFYTIVGFAIVTEVQLFVILLGSLGLIPLTGVSVPFMSYGRAGLAMNIAAFGIIIAMTRHKPNPLVAQRITGYNSVMTASMVLFVVLFIVAVGDLLRYQYVYRDEYLTKTAMITYINGDRNREQNPRVKRLLRHLTSGNIYDRNGLLLATSSGKILRDSINSLGKVGLDTLELKVLSHKHPRRFYPFKEHLFFMLGDMNTQNLLGSVYRGIPYGYLAEERHLGTLRGIDIKILNDSNIQYQYKTSSFTQKRDAVHEKIRYADYSNIVIVDMLKQGIHGSLVKAWNSNDRLKKRNLHLTIDAKLQKEMQEKFEANSHLLTDSFSRVSMVILKADSGDLICSANYPRPDQTFIAKQLDRKVYNYKRDSTIGRYTERDLALTYQSRPGSTAKVISAMAGLKGLKDCAAKQKYQIEERYRIYRGKSYQHEPYSYNGWQITMEDAIHYSSNCYFILLINENPKLYDELDTIYQTVGVRMNSYCSYLFDFDSQTEDNCKNFHSLMMTLQDNCVKRYADYMSWSYDKQDNKDGSNKGMSQINCKFLYGMGEMEASPLNMARIAAIVANNGVFAHTKYLINAKSDLTVLLPDTIMKWLKKFMKVEAQDNITSDFAKIGGGKTGTPTREIKIFNNGEIVRFKNRKGELQETKEINDGWYISYIDSAYIGNNMQRGKLAVALRIEQCSGSGKAREWMKKVVLPTLNSLGYIKYSKNKE